MIRKNIIISFLKKEFKQIFRDPRMKLVIFVPPILLMLINGNAVSTDVYQVRMAILDEDKTPQSRTLIDQFTSSGYFIPHAYIGSAKGASRLLDTGEVEVFLQIEKGFSNGIKSSKVSMVQIIIDGTDSSRAAVIAAYVSEISSKFSMEFLKSRIRTLAMSKGTTVVKSKGNVELKERFLYNPELSSTNFFLPGMLCLIISMVSISLTSMSIVKEREKGTIDQILVSPVSAIEIIIGKTVPFVFISFIHLLTVTGVAMLWFKVPFKGNFLFLMFSSAAFIFSTTGMGLYISTISKTQQQSILSTFMFVLPAIIFSGFAFPIYAMPEIIQYVTYLNPLRYFMIISRAVFLKGVGMEILWMDFLLMTVLGVVFFYLSAIKFRKGLE